MKRANRGGEEKRSKCMWVSVGVSCVSGEETEIEREGEREMV